MHKKLYFLWWVVARVKIDSHLKLHDRLSVLASRWQPSSSWDIQAVQQISLLVVIIIFIYFNYCIHCKKQNVNFLIHLTEPAHCWHLFAWIWEPWMNSDASYSSTKQKTKIICFFSIAENQKKLMFLGTFLAVERKSHPDLQLDAASVSLLLICIKTSNHHSGLWYCAARCRQGNRRPSSRAYSENERLLAASNAHETFSVSLPLSCIGTTCCDKVNGKEQ